MSRDSRPRHDAGNAVLTAGDVIGLEREVGAPRLSLFLPLLPGSRRVWRPRIEARNALLRADRALRGAGLAGARLLDGLAKALHQPRTIEHGHVGLALFADASGVRQYHVPVQVPRLAVVGDRFTVPPVLSSTGPAASSPCRGYDDRAVEQPWLSADGSTAAGRRAKRHEMTL